MNDNHEGPVPPRGPAIVFRQGENAYEQQFQLRRLAAITETAKSLGYTLVPNVAAG